jgi:hypothetical protein
MQVYISEQEQQDILAICEIHGGMTKFCEKAGIVWQTLKKLCKEGRADEVVVKKVRAFLRTKYALLLIEQGRKAIAA